VERKNEPACVNASHLPKKNSIDNLLAWIDEELLSRLVKNLREIYIYKLCPASHVPA
jgi:hypothetical protein